MQKEANKIYHDSKNALYTDLIVQIQVNVLFSSKERPLHQEPFQLGQHATPNGSQFSSEEKILFDRHNQILSRTSTHIGFLYRIKKKSN